MRDRLLKVLSQECPDIVFSMDADLVDDGVLDSLSIVQIISAISIEFSVMLPLEVLLPQNFNSVDAMLELLQKYNAK